MSRPSWRRSMLCWCGSVLATCVLLPTTESKSGAWRSSYTLYHQHPKIDLWGSQPATFAKSGSVRLSDGPPPPKKKKKKQAHNQGGVRSCLRAKHVLPRWHVCVRLAPCLLMTRYQRRCFFQQKPPSIVLCVYLGHLLLDPSDVDFEGGVFFLPNDSSARCRPQRRCPKATP